jgi:hypothetical protein
LANSPTGPNGTTIIKVLQQLKSKINEVNYKPASANEPQTAKKRRHRQTTFRIDMLLNNEIDTTV